MRRPSGEIARSRSNPETLIACCGAGASISLVGSATDDVGLDDVALKRAASIAIAAPEAKAATGIATFHRRARGDRGAVRGAGNWSPTPGDRSAAKASSMSSRAAPM